MKRYKYIMTNSRFIRHDKLDKQLCNQAEMVIDCRTGAKLKNKKGPNTEGNQGNIK